MCNRTTVINLPFVSNKLLYIGGRMEWKKNLEIAYDAFDKGLGIRPIARVSTVQFFLESP